MAISASTFGDIGGAVSDLFSGYGQLQSAKGYKKAAAFAQQNAEIAKQSEAIQEQQAQRKVYQTIGGQQADVAGAGLAASGSALDILRDSAQQGALTVQLVKQQGAINVAGYEAEASSYSSMASAAKSAGAGGILGGLIKGGAALMAFSDDRLKEGIVLEQRRRDGVGIYSFAFKGSAQRFRGVLASEVERIYPQAVSWEGGHRLVNYALIGVEPEVVNA